MPKFKDFDDYIENAQEFAQPILNYLRACVHEVCPEAKEEFKWSFPNFTYKGQILCNMAGFKQHVSFGFWLAQQMRDPDKVMHLEENSGMGSFGHITSMKDLPSKKILLKYIQEAVQLIEDGAKLERKPPKKTTKVLQAPEDLRKELNANATAFETFNNFSQSHRNEYIAWIEDAKTEKTRLKRLKLTMEWLEEGKPRDWKYMRK